MLSLFTVSVTDDASVKYFDDDDIRRVMEDEHSDEQKDLILLIQKKKYSNWIDIDSTGSKSSEKYDDGFFNLHGTAMNQKGKPLSNAVTILICPKPQNFFEVDTTDEEEHFKFHTNGYPDSTRFLIQLADKKGNPVEGKVELDSIVFPRVKTPLNLKKYLPMTTLGEIDKKNKESNDFILPAKGKELKEVIVRARVKKPPTYDESKRVSLFSKVLTRDMIKTSGRGSIANSLMFIPGVQLKGHQFVLAGNYEEPLLVVDGVEIEPEILSHIRDSGMSPLMSYLNTFNPTEIDFIEVLTGGEAAIYGMEGANGVIIVHTRAGMGYQADNKTYVTNFYPKGYSNSTAFLEPDYSKENSKKDDTPDRRTTIYWSGPLITDNNGEATIHFFTADPNTTYTVTVKGVTVSGDIFVKRFHIDRM